MARILVGGILQETNTFSPLKETYDSFNIYKGTAILNYLHTSPAKLIEEAGHEVVPAVYASIIPSGLLSKEEFLRFIDDFLSCCVADIDGIWLSLHGAMTVSDIGSGEAYLVSRLREHYGRDIPIFGSFDFHGNMSLELVRQMNYITAYRTAPHVDIYETGCRAVRALLRSLDSGTLPHCKYIPIPLVLAGELVITQDYPTRYFQEKLRQLENDWNVPDLSLFCGFAWSDCPRNRMAITVSDDQMDKKMLAQILDLAAEIWSMRHEFNYGAAVALEPAAAVLYARDAKSEKVFLSDTGDNVTAGCAGDNAFLTKLMIDSGLENALLAGIADAPAVAHCFAHRPGDILTLELGGTIDPQNSERITITGELLNTHTFEAEEIPTPLRVAILRVGGVDILICEQRYSVTSRKRIRDAGLCYENYRIIAVKLGYLFPDLAEEKPCSILALTPGNAYQNTARIPYTNAPTRYYPRDDFEFTPEYDPEDI